MEIKFKKKEPTIGLNKKKKERVHWKLIQVRPGASQIPLMFLKKVVGVGFDNKYIALIQTKHVQIFSQKNKRYLSEKKRTLRYTFMIPKIREIKP